MPRRKKGQAHYHFWVVTAYDLVAPDYVKAVRSFQTFRHRVQAVRGSKIIRRDRVLDVKTAICYDRKCPSPESGKRGSLGF